MASSTDAAENKASESPSAPGPAPGAAKAALENSARNGAGSLASAKPRGLVVEGLSKSYGQKLALGGVSFNAPDAGFTVLLGPGGAGKTTTLRLLAGLEPQSAGSIWIDGKEISNLAPRDRGLAMIFDNLALYPNKNGFQNLASPLVQKGRPFEEVRSRVFAMARKLNLSLVLDRLPKTMSGGEKQRLALGRALVRAPRLFLLDEPLSSLDAPLRFMIRSELKRLQKEEGHSFLMATPDFAEALAVGDSIIMLRGGRVVQTGKPSEIYESPVDTATALFVGSPRINLVKARCEGGWLNFLGLKLPCPGKLRARLEPAGPKEITLGVRPENAEPALSGDGGAPPLGELEVVDLEPLGRTLAVTLGLGGENLTLLAESRERSRVSIGSRLPFRISDPESLLAFDESGRNILAS
jgi:multiple sugar transport system ATP-binding protein